MHSSRNESKERIEMSLNNPDRRPQSTNISCVTFLFLLFISSGSLLTFWGTSALKESRASLNWPAVTGKVMNVDIFVQDSEEIYPYIPYITYQYVVDDKKYTSRRVRIAGEYTYGNECAARNAVSMYALNAPVTVYYDPEEPEQALLEHQITGYGNLIVGGIFTGAGLIGILFPIMSKKRGQLVGKYSG